jgi:nucleolar protein 14
LNFLEVGLPTQITMPPSQLKALKAKLREQGITGPQQSKKQRKQNAQNGNNKDKRFSRNDALNGIREQFNPFEFQKAGGKAPKFEVTSIEARKPKGVLRPGVKKSMDQEMVCSILLHVGKFWDSDSTLKMLRCASLRKLNSSCIISEESDC